MPEAGQQPLQKPELSPLALDLAGLIRREGPVGLDVFMARAGQEYYAGPEPFGAAGDFTTAPEISQMFGELIGAWIADLWMQMGRPPRLMLVELGPGRGTLAADILRTLANWPECRAALALHLVENSPALRQRQAAALGDYSPIWHDRLETLPPGPAIFLANEFLDALPIRQYVRAAGQWRERLVDFHPARQEFAFVLGHAPVHIAVPAGYPAAAEGDVFETSPASLDIVSQISRRIAEQGGAALFVDYGGDKFAFGDTTQGFHRHARAGILDRPGRQDVTANVDFPALALAASAAVKVHGPVTQGAFLNRLGLPQRAEALSRKATPAQKAAITAAMRRLADTSEMGALFKVMALTPQESGLLPSGFDI